MEKQTDEISDTNTSACECDNRDNNNDDILDIDIELFQITKECHFSNLYLQSMNKQLVHLTINMLAKLAFPLPNYPPNLECGDIVLHKDT